MELIPFFADTVKMEVENEDITFWVETNPLLPEYSSILTKKAKHVLSDRKKKMNFLIQFCEKPYLFRVSYLNRIKYSTIRRNCDYMYMILKTYGSGLSEFKKLFNFSLYRNVVALNVTGLFFISEINSNHEELKEMGIAYLSLFSHREIRQKVYEFVRNELKEEMNK